MANADGVGPKWQEPGKGQGMTHRLAMLTLLAVILPVASLGSTVGVGTSLAKPRSSSVPTGAGTVKVSVVQEREGEYGTFEYVAARGQRNRLRISVTATRARIEDSAGVRPGRRCRRVSDTVATCSRDRSWASEDVYARLGDGSDRASVRGVGASLFGGPGSDVLRVSASDSSEAILVGGSGNDRLVGGSGRNTFWEGTHRSGRDTMVGGAGSDVVDYGSRKRAVRADLSGDRDDGERGERDRIGRNVEDLTGGRGADRLTGNGTVNEIAGGAGGDRIKGLGDDDQLSGGKEVDTYDGTRGTNRIDGGSGDDDLLGAEGPDLLTPGPGLDEVDGSSGSDRIDTRDASTDLVACDNGDSTRGRRDRASVDELDFLEGAAGCERLDRHGVARGVFVGFRDKESDAHVIEVNADDGKALVEVGCSTDAPDPCRGSVELREGSRSLGSGLVDLPRGKSDFVEVPLSPADYARVDSRSGVRATLVLRPAGLEEQALGELLVQSRAGAYKP